MLQLNQISYSFSEFTLGPLSLKLKEPFVMALMGASGCGKSTLLDLIYGLRDLEAGTVFWDKRELLGPAYHLVPGHNGMNYMAQGDQLMPYSSVRSNIQKYLSRQQPEDSEKKMQELLALVDMQGAAERNVKNLSGGQQQRVALAQVLAKKPKLLLLDEPFNFIDTALRVKLRRHLFDYLEREQISCIIATHDSQDVLGFAQKLLILNNGKKVVCDRPSELFKKPGSIYTASLLGDLNRCQASLFSSYRKGVLLTYPGELELGSKNGIDAHVTKCYFKGTYFLVQIQILETREILHVMTQKIFKVGQKTSVQIRDENLLENRVVTSTFK